MAAEIEQMQGSSNDLKVLLTNKDEELVTVNTRLEVVQGEYEVIRRQKDVLLTENASVCSQRLASFVFHRRITLIWFH